MYTKNKEHEKVDNKGKTNKQKTYHKEEVVTSVPVF